MKQSILICDLCNEDNNMPIAVERVSIRTMHHGAKTMDLCDGCFQVFIEGNLLENTEPQRSHDRSRSAVPFTDRVLEQMLNSNGKVWTPDDIVREYGVAPKKARGVLLTLYKGGAIERVGRGEYRRLVTS